ncbi:MAG: ribosomal RNA small subunit methyltransferase A [Kiritimatiellae bacterium]|nr:ribosomal RNA small subunit methyltransferase A [Kiritimatiellia bacterium]
MDPAAVDYCSPREVGALLRERGIRPSKALGQNFLVDRNVLAKIVEAAALPPGARVLEVGAGLGVLTAALLDAGARVAAVEKDEALWPVLEARFGGRDGFSLVKGDALELDWEALLGAPDGPRHLVSNLPYSVGSRVVVDAALCAAPPDSMTLLLQKEVCDRFAAAEGSPARGAASVWLQRLYDVRAVRDVPPGCFLPRPDVTSSVLSLRLHGRHPLGREAAEKFRALVKEAFLHRRKQIASSMRSAGGGLARSADAARAALRAAGAPETARAEELSVERWLALAAAW